MKVSKMDERGVKFWKVREGGGDERRGGFPEGKYANHGDFLLLRALIQCLLVLLDIFSSHTE